MAELTPEIASEVVAACRAGADEIAGALTRALDSEFLGITIGETATYDAEKQPAGFDGPGLVVLLKFGATGAVALIPESSGLLPDWYADPDPTGKSKLNTLAQELGMLVVPSSLMADATQAFRIDKLSDGVARAEVSAGAVLVPMSLKCDEKEAQLSFLWPLAKPDELNAKPVVEETSAEPASSTPSPDQPTESELEQLPRHTRSFFKVRVPVAVTLATQKQSVQDIIDLVPGSIIKFDKSCDELLDLVVGDQTIAAGEVVKVGDKFGLRVRNIILPQEQFVAIKATMPG